MMAYSDPYREKADMLPEHMRESIILWIEHGHAAYPGSFMTALLSNDLMGAIGKADEVNAAALRTWAVYLYNYAPSGCFGSPEKFKAWQGLYTRQDAQAAEQQVAS